MFSLVKSVFQPSTFELVHCIIKVNIESCISTGMVGIVGVRLDGCWIGIVQ
jgi:hypothetical protein